MTTAKYRRRDDLTTPAPGAHYIESGVKIYLMRDPAGLDRWVIDPSTVDGYALDPINDDMPINEECCCEDAHGCDRALARMAAAHLPTGVQVMVMLADALGYTITAQDQTR
ncbi:hypothetical protein [Gordonia rhizosphera]|uniref:Uncharacterized protein n=1 Tax=Gordonia rhizosphera NBRC 16068 TaxID=1108045 RepID=K6WA37_9ACTN|nr:hypothetical protein [Gordonia rhizosphera]GAB89072.1 hypothetical protein GORHZ_049_00050 [Gordonia rhizosphera NBRC 16068]